MSVPTAPLISIRPRATNEALTFYWAPPSSNGGSAITGYELTCTGVTTSYPAASDRTYTVSGLTNNTQYTFSLAAVNGNGTGATATFRTVRPGNKASAAQVPTCALTDLSDSAVINWNFSSSNGDAEIGWYVVRAYPMGDTTPFAKFNTYGYLSTLQAPGLDLKYSPWTFNVYAVNDPGYAPAATTNEVGGMTWVTQSGAGSRNWYSITMSGKGSLMLACVTGGSVWRSADYGITWVELGAGNGLPTGAGFITVAMSQSGTYAIAAIAGNYLFTSSNLGISWTDTGLGGGGAVWNSSAIGSDGLYQIMGTNGQYIWTSTDSGNSWVEQTGGPTGIWSDVDVSVDGSTMVACDYGSGSGGSIWISSDYGASWTERTSAGTRIWKGICISSGGNNMAATTADGSIYTSVDYGVTWVERTRAGSAGWGPISCSYDGTRLATFNSAGYIARSADSGATWTIYNPPASQSLFWIASSVDGHTIATCAYGGAITTGMLTRNTWLKQTGSGQRDWAGSQAISANGLKLAVPVSGGYIWTSTDGGVTWAEQTSGLTIQTWTTVVGSSNGAKLAAAAYGDYIYTSTNSGATWTQQTNSGSRQWRSMACSTNGNVIVAGVDTTGYVYVSTDSGATWAGQAVGSTTISGVACSGDGSTILVLAVGGYMHLSTNTGSTWTAITSEEFEDWASCTMSADGVKMAVTYSTNGRVRTSLDSGATWTEHKAGGAPFGTLRSISMSADGSALLLLQFGGYIWRCDDILNESWIQVPLPFNANFQSVALNADGTRGFAPIYQNYVWTMA